MYQSHDTKAESLEDVFKTAWSIQVLEELMNGSFSWKRKMKKKKGGKQNYNMARAKSPYAEFVSSHLCDSKGKKFYHLFFLPHFLYMWKEGRMVLNRHPAPTARMSCYVFKV